MLLDCGAARVFPLRDVEVADFAPEAESLELSGLVPRFDRLFLMLPNRLLILLAEDEVDVLEMVGLLWWWGREDVVVLSRWLKRIV